MKRKPSINEPAATIWKAAYKPFGQVATDFGSIGIAVGTGNNQISWTPPFRFPGQYADPELQGEMFYNHHRFYMPAIGRYTSPDPLKIASDNPYAYVLNNPTTNVDPMALWTWSGHEKIMNEAFKRACADLGYTGVSPLVAQMGTWNAEVDLPPGKYTDKYHKADPNAASEEINKIIGSGAPYSEDQMKDLSRWSHPINDDYSHKQSGGMHHPKCDNPEKNPVPFQKAIDSEYGLIKNMVIKSPGQFCTGKGN